MTLTPEQINAAIASANWGKPSAAKRGRTAERPYVPIIDYGEQRTGLHRHRTRQIMRKAFATREEAVAYAATYIAHAQAMERTHLQDPRMRALREQYGLPREIV